MLTIIVFFLHVFVVKDMGVEEVESPKHDPFVNGTREVAHVCFLLFSIHLSNTTNMQDSINQACLFVSL